MFLKPNRTGVLQPLENLVTLHKTLFIAKLLCEPHQKILNGIIFIII